MRLLSVTLLVALGVFASKPLAGQNTITGDVVGIVTDPSGAVVPGAAVTLISRDNGFTQTNTTGAQGVYRFSLLQPGPYAVSAAAQGFEPAKKPIIVFLGQSISGDLRLTIQSAKIAVDVVADPFLLTQTPDVSTTYNTSQVTNLPDPGNDITSIVQSAPGVVMNTQGGLGNFSTYGLPAISNLFTLDGMSQNDPIFNTNISGATNLLLGHNEIQEATIVNNGYSGSYGSFAGANVNYVTKSGSDTFHGNVIYWWNGTILNANNWFNNDVPRGTPAVPRPFSNANQYAASFGGPIKKGKLFYFADYEGLRLALPTSALTLVPSPQFEAAAIANLVATGHGPSIPFYQKMFDLWNSAPGMDRAAPGIPQVGDPFGCNGFADGTGLGSTEPCALSFFSNAGNSTHEYLLGARFDANINNNDKLFIHLRENQGLQGTYTDPINPVFNVQSSQPIYQGQVSETHIFSARAVNLLIVSALYDTFVKQPKSLDAALAAFPTTLALGDQTFTSLGGMNSNVPFGDSFTSYQILDDLSLTSGRHNLKVGLSFYRVDISDHNYGDLLAGFVLPFTVADFFAGGATGDILFQNFPSSRVKPLARYGLGLYAEDGWRVTKSLNLTISLRADHSSNPVCQTNCFARLVTPFAMLNHDPDIPYDEGVRTGLHRALPSFTNLAWQPRIGFVWTPSHMRGLVLSGGVGIFLDTLPGFFVGFLSSNPPLRNSFTTSFNNLAPTEPSNIFKDAATSNATFVASFSNGGTLASNLEADPFFTPPNITNTVDMKAPRYQEWNLQFQQVLGLNTSLSLDYVGNHGTHIPVSFNGLNAFCPPSDPACPNGFLGLPSSAPDPRFSVVTEIRSVGISNYSGLIVSVRHQFKTSFQMQANYTWSHALDEVSNGGILAFGFGSAGSLLNPQDGNNVKRYSYGNADYDTRHYFSANYLWEIPHKVGPAWLLDGWQVSGTVFARTGFPYTVLDSNTANLLSSFGYGGSVYANYSGKPVPRCSSPKHSCLDESEFSSPISETQPAFGAQRRNQFYGPGFFDTDLAITKKTKIPGWERGEFGIGAQFFNLLNHPNFDKPNADLSNPSLFGQITGTVSPPTSILGFGLGGDASPRLIQLTAHITF
jgi:hypothetical protein